MILFQLLFFDFFDLFEFVLFILLLINDLSFSIDIIEFFFNELSKDSFLIFVINLSLLKVKSSFPIRFKILFEAVLSIDLLLFFGKFGFLMPYL